MSGIMQMILGGTQALPGKYTTPLLDGTVILSGYGLMIYKTGYGDGNATEVNFVVPANVTKIRAIVLGAGGGASGSENVVGAQAGAGIEGFITVTAGETLVVGVGLGGVGAASGTAGTGGTSYIRRGSTYLMTGDGGLSTYYTNFSSGLSRSTTSYNGSISLISRGAGGTGGTEGYSPESDLNAIAVSVNLSGATAHAGGAGGWQSHPYEFYGLGLGFGGGGGYAGNGADSSTIRAGGIYGYAGGWGNSFSNGSGGGPVGGQGNSAGTTSGFSGGGGGSFGGSGVDGWSGGYGAGGLVRIWWASSAGDPTWINTGGNYGS